MKNKKSLLGIGLIGMALALVGVILTKSDVTIAAECNECCTLICNQHYYSSGSKCVKCDTGYTAPLQGPGGRDRCTRTCQGATHVATTGGACELCPDGFATGAHVVSGGNISYCFPCNNKPSIAAYYTGPGSGGLDSCPWECESGFEKSADGNSCVCPENTYYDSTSNSCQPCQNGYTSAPGLGGVNSCQKKCDGGYHVESPRGSCVECGVGSGRTAHTQLATGTSICSGCVNGPTNKDEYPLNVGYYYTTNGTSTGSCTWECASGYYLSGTYPNGKCIPCTGGYYTPDGSGAKSVEKCVTHCPLNHHVAIGGHACEQCPSNAQTTPAHNVPQGMTTDCGKTCPEDTYLSGGACEPCPYPRTSLAGSTSINDCKIECSECEHVEEGRGECVSCPAGETTPNPIVTGGNISQCGVDCTNAPTEGSEYISAPACCSWQCSAGYYLNFAGTKCVECPYGSSEPGSHSVSDCGCGLSPDNGQYDETCRLICDAGYYKNLAGTGCEKCTIGSSMPGSVSVNDCKEAQCGEAISGSRTTEPTTDLCDNGTGVNTGTSNSQFTWDCDYYGSTTSCAVTRSYPCDGIIPGGIGYTRGGYTRPYNYTPTEWTYISDQDPGACEWTCKSGYEKSGNNCVEKQSQCGPAAGQSHTSEPSESDLCGDVGVSSNFSSGACLYSWKCTHLSNTVSCNATRLYDGCGGDTPSGAGVVTGGSIRTCSDTPNWTYTNSDTPGVCQWTCEAGYISGTNKCIEKTPQCGTSAGGEFKTAPAVGLCDVNVGALYGSVHPTTTGFDWTCKNLTKSVSCSAKRIYDCGGDDPYGAGVVTGENTYKSGHTPTVWTYKSIGDLSGCEWRCQPGYISGTNTCIAEQPYCGLANGGNYSSTPTLLCNPGSNTGVDEGSCSYTWQCSKLYNSVSCSATRTYPCEGDTPSGDGVEIGKKNYTCTDTSTEWTYRANGTLGACQWRCRGGYEQRAGNTCEYVGYSDLEMYFMDNVGNTGYVAMMDRNLGATAYMGEDGKDPNDWYGNYYQWGNSYGFSNQGDIKTGITQVNVSTYGPSKPYSGDTFIIGYEDWSSDHNGNLWGGDGNPVYRKGPCPTNYHVPNESEFNVIINENRKKSADYTSSNMGTQRGLDALMPLAGRRSNGNSNAVQQELAGMYWSSTPYSDNRYAYYHSFSLDSPYYGLSDTIYSMDDSFRANGFSVRCVKNSPTPSLTIYPYGGTGALIIVHNNIITKLGTPSSGNAVFEGWYKNYTFTSEEVQAGQTIPGSKTLYAKWRSAECGTASGQTYPTLTASSQGLCDNGNSVSNFSATTTGFTWKCTYSTSEISCSAAKEQNCTGTPPQGDHVLMGASTYVSTHTPTSWTYTANSSLTGCQWSCETGYVDKGNKCVTPQEKECGPYDPNDFLDLDMYFVTNEGITGHYTLMDRNIGATQVYNGTNNICTYGYYYQWGNNYGFSNTGDVNKSSIRVDASSYGPSEYLSDVLIVSVYANWMYPKNDNLWGDIDDTPVARQGPCPTGYHIPAGNEFVDLVDNYWVKSVNDTGYRQWALDSLMSFAGERIDGNPANQGHWGAYWSSTPDGLSFAYSLSFGLNNIHANSKYGCSNALSLRCVKNTPNSILTIHKNGGTGALIIVHGNEITKLGSPTRSGAEFLGWYSDSGFTDRVYENNNVPASANLYAKWNLTQCPVGYYIAGDSCVQCQPGYYCPDGQNRSGCVVGDYNSERGAASCTSCPTGYTTTGTKSTSVTQCHKRLSVQYYTNGATNIGKTSDGCNAFCTTATNCEDSCGVIAPNITRAGFDILGWNTNQNATNGTTVGGTITLAGSHNSSTSYYAITKKIVNGTFRGGEGVLSVSPRDNSCIILNNNSTCDIPIATATCRAGSYGPHWDLQVLDGFLNGLSDDVTATASCYKCPDGTTSAVGSLTVDQCVSTSCPAGKYKSGDNCVPCPNGTTSNAGAADVTQCYKTFTATFNKNGATSICSNAESCDAPCADATCNSLSCSVSMPANCIDRDGFEILGWSTNQNATSASYTTNEPITLTANATYYAITKKDVTFRFIKGLGVLSLNRTNKSCTIWNNANCAGYAACSMSFPELIAATCDTGYYNPTWDPSWLNGVTYPSLCVTGSADAVANCTACPGTYISSPGATTESQCYVVCTGNTYVPAVYGPCVPCPGDSVKGDHTVNRGNSESACGIPECPVGKYYNFSTQLCTNCPNGYTTSGPGKQAVTECYKTFTATFNANGATSVSSGSKSCNVYCTTVSNCQNSCTITVPSASRGVYWTRVGWSTDPNAHTAMYTASEPYVTLTSDMTFYAITKQECPAGKYSVAGADQCKPCPAGKYNGGTLTAYNTTPTSCSNVRCGCYGSSQGATTDCPSSCSSIGQYSLAGATSCSSCDNGPEGGEFSYTSNGGNGGCSNSCEWECKEGFYYDSEYNKCIECPGGYTSDAGAKGIDKCFARCPCGSFVKNAYGKCESCGGSKYAVAEHKVYRGKTSAQGGYSCKLCTNGPDQGTPSYIGNNCKNTACDWVCAKNFYKQSTNVCKACNTNYYTDSAGATDASACKINCPAGTHVVTPGGKCVGCDVGYATGANTMSQGQTGSCVPCNSSVLPTNASWSSSGTTINNCQWQCNAGYYLSGGKCRSCVTDYGAGYFSNTGKNYCFELPRCGSSNGQEFTSMPSKYLCSVGSNDGITVGHGTWDGSNWNCPVGGCDMNRIAGWSWHCYRIMDGVTYTVSCMAPRKTSCDADCGSAEDGESLKCYKSSSVTCPNTCDGSRLQGYNSKTLTCIDGERKKGVSVTQTNGTVSISYTNDSFGDYIYSSCQTQNQTLPYTWSSCPAAYVGCSNVSISVSNNNGGCSSATRKQWNGTSCATNYHKYTDENGTKYCKPNAKCRSVQSGGVAGGTFASTWSSLSVRPYGCEPGKGVAVDENGNEIYNAPFNSYQNLRYWRCTSYGHTVNCQATKSTQAATSCACQGQYPNRVCCYVGHYGMGVCSRSCSTCGNCN